jgi:long-chain acyl-CoA synthetase
VLSDLGKATDKQVVRESLGTTLQFVNPKLKSYERVQKLVVLREPWTVENNKMTPTLKIKRNIIETEFASKVDVWYNKSEVVIFE